MEWTINVHKDRDPINSLPEEVVKLLQKEKLLTQSEQNVSFTGLLFHDKYIEVFLPRSSEAGASYTKLQLASLVFNSIRLYSEEFDSVVSNNDGSLGDTFDGLSLNLILKLLHDYRQNGIYTKRHSLNTLNSGKPNWNKTISRSTAYPSGKNLIYLDVHGSKWANSSTCEVSQVHAQVIKELESKFSILFFGHAGVFSEFHIEEPSNLSADYLLHVLNKELTLTYSARDIWLLQSLIQYLSVIRGKLKSELKVGVKHFHTVWEYMLSQTLDKTISINKLLPTPTYKLTNGNIVTAPRKGQRLDVVLYEEATNTFCIVDAKYYAADSITTAPGWPDLVKQFFYVKALRTIEPSAKISNAFVFPGTNEYLASAHMLEKKSKKLLDIEYPPIDCVYVEPLELMESFTNYRKMTLLSIRLTQ
jgi:hypothetical protein